MTSGDVDPAVAAADTASIEGVGGERQQTDPREPPRASWREAALIAAVVSVGTALAVSYAFDPERAGMLEMLGAIGALYVSLAVVTALWLRSRGELRAAFRPMSGDLARGAFVAALLYGMTMAIELVVTRHGTPREAWIMRLYLQLGDPAADARVFVGAAVFVVAALEEVVWRGFVMRALAGPLGREVSWLVASALFAVAHVPTAFLLGDPVAGPNPLVIAAGLGCSVVWGRMVLRTGRLVPSIFAHAFFSWAVVSFPVWRP